MQVAQFRTRHNLGSIMLEHYYSRKTCFWLAETFCAVSFVLSVQLCSSLVWNGIQGMTSRSNRWFGGLYVIVPVTITNSLQLLLYIFRKKNIHAGKRNLVKWLKVFIYFLELSCDNKSNGWICSENCYHKDKIAQAPWNHRCRLP